MVFFMNGLTLFLTSCLYLTAFILPSNSTKGSFPCQEKRPQIMTECCPFAPWADSLDGVCLPHHAWHIDSAAVVDSDKLALIGKKRIFPILNRKMCMLSGPLSPPTLVVQTNQRLLLCRSAKQAPFVEPMPDCSG